MPAAILALVLLAATARADDAVDRLRADVSYLADDDLAGRLAPSEGHAEAARFVVERFGALSLAPAFESGFVQTFTSDDVEYTNVVAVVPGSSPETIVIGAHYDHLGVAADGDVFNGADDNASGVAALLEIARLVADEGPFGRTVVFAAFDGEEQGLRGSTHYMAHPASAPIVTMLNLDSVGRLRDGRLLCLGVATGDIFADMIDGVSRVFDLDLAISEPVHPAGDHLPFFRAGIPVLHFFTDGHEDYHRVGDTTDKVNVDGLNAVTEFVTEIVRYLSDPSVPVRFVPAGAEQVEEKKAPTRQRTVSFGTIPDFARESGGLLVTGVLPGSAADEAGILVGDLIVDIDGQTIDNLYDYQGVLAERKPGDTMRVTYERDGARHETEAVLRARR